MIITSDFSCMTLLRLCILRGLDIENDDMAAVSRLKCSSRLSFGHVIVIIICILSYVAFRRLRILSCQVFENDDMAAVLAPELCSRSSFRGVRVPIICNLPYKDGLLAEGLTCI